MLGDKNFNKTLLACQSMSKRVVQWQLSVSFWYAPDSEKKQITDLFFNRMGKMFNKVFDHFYWGCHVVKEAMRQMMAELDKDWCQLQQANGEEKKKDRQSTGEVSVVLLLESDGKGGGP